MAIHPKISPRIINSIATLYNDVNRVFMEYVDNSIDSADEHWFDPVKNAYSRPIEITVKIKGDNHKNGSIIISDNCFGITNFTKVVESIGDSDKKHNRFTNGQFGFGIYSFMAACSNLEVASKEKKKHSLGLVLDREQFDRKSVEEVNIPNPKETKNFPYESGTVILLNSFDRGAWKIISATVLKSEIEKHFELILRRKNLAVKIVDQSGSEFLCVAFDYDQYEGEIYEDYIQDLAVRDKRVKARSTLSFPTAPVHIFLKMTNGVSIGKQPVFISKGRRICEIKDVKSFKSQHKGDIWGHSNVTGYIDLQDLLPPTIARTDFKNTRESRALFQQLNELEELILDFVKRANSSSDERHYQQLEDALNKALSKLARIDAMRFRTEYLKGGAVNLVGGSLGTEFAEVGGMKDFGDGEIENPGDGIGEGEGAGIGPIEGGDAAPGGSAPGVEAKNEELLEDSDFKGRERKKSGFNIHISDAEPQIDGETGKALRSMLSGSQIVIFKKHPDFQTRLSHTRQGESKITDKLVSYLAGEITVHYKDEFYKKYQNGQPEYNKQMFVSLVEFIYQLENTLSVLSGKNLSEL